MYVNRGYVNVSKEQRKQGDAPAIADDATSSRRLSDAKVAQQAAGRAKLDASRPAGWQAGQSWLLSQ